MPSNPPEAGCLALEDIAFSYGLPQAEPVLGGVSLALAAGERLALLGPNGSGKTTLLKIAAGVLSPDRGQVLLEGKPLSAMPRREAARCVAVVPQNFHLPFAFRVREVVSLGRTPYAQGFSGEGAADREAVARALAATDTAALAERIFNELSGGERQRVVLALALAQEPRVLLLDEPTAHLDLCHRLELLELVRHLSESQGLTVLAALHDLNLAALYFPRVALLKGGMLFAQGTPAATFTEANIWEVFGAAVQVSPHPTHDAPSIVVLPREGAARTAPEFAPPQQGAEKPFRPSPLPPS